MDKKSSRKAGIRFGPQILSVMLSVILILNTAVFAYADEAKLPKVSRWPVALSENSERTVSENTRKAKAVGHNEPQGIRLTELVLTDLDEPEAGKPYDKTATVTSHEEVSWDIPVYWIDSNGKTVDQPTAGRECLPLIVFYVPGGYVSDGFLELTPYLSDVFRKAGGVLSIIDHELGVTYITAYVKGFDDSEPGVVGKRSPGETYDNTGEYIVEKKAEDSLETDEPEIPENDSPSNEPEQTDDSSESDVPEESEDDPPVDEPEEPDPYVEFAEKYRDDNYRHIPWDEELEAFGGMEEIDCVRLVKACGYIGARNLNSSISGSFQVRLEYQELNNALASALKEVAKELYEQADPYIKAHTSDIELVARSNQESLSQYIHMIIDNVIPQAIQLLRENFPAFSAADDENFSRELGLDLILSQKEGSAYVSNSFEYSDDFYAHLTVSMEPYRDLLDSNSAYTYTPTEEGRNIPFLKQTILHEMMHVFMGDYNRNGELQFVKIRQTETGNYYIPGIGELDPSTKDALHDTLEYPRWFAEGIASLCGTPFAEYEWYYDCMLSDNVEKSYTASGLYEFSQSRRLTMDSTDYIHYYQDDTYNNYIFGPLAVMYMGEMYNRKTTGESTVLTDADGSISIDTIAIRNGVSAIMERMHNGETMDSVIADISDGKYRDTQDLCTKYFDMDGPNMDSMSFAANVLNYTFALSNENGNSVRASILKPFDENILDLIDVTKTVSTNIYVIQDGTDFVKSTVPDEIAFRTGGKSDPGEVLGIREGQDHDAALNGSDGIAGTETEADSTSNEEDLPGGEVEPEAADCGAVPDASISEDAVPDASISEDAVPDEAVSEDAAPDEPVCEDAAPGEPASEEVVPNESVNKDAVPDEAVSDSGAENYEDFAEPDPVQCGEAA